MHANATVTICHSKTRNLPEVVRQADVVGRRYRQDRDGEARLGEARRRCGRRGKPTRFPTAQRFTVCSVDDPVRWKDFEKRGYIWAGDVDERGVRDVASLMTPVPGGVGPMTIRNAHEKHAEAARLRRAI